MVKQCLSVYAPRVERPGIAEFHLFSAKWNAALFAFSQPSPPFTSRKPRLLGCAKVAGAMVSPRSKINFDMEANLALTVLPYIAAALGVAVFALTTSAPAINGAEKSDAN